jgi:hypothetical protein
MALLIAPPTRQRSGTVQGAAVVCVVVAVATVLLDGIDHVCCGPVRQVGDTVTIQIHNYRGQVYEERHAGGVSIATQPMTGTKVWMEWCPAIVRKEARAEGFTAITLEGYGPGISIESTEYEDPDAENWVFRFAVETDDSIPEPRKN